MSAARWRFQHTPPDGVVRATKEIALLVVGFRRQRTWLSLSFAVEPCALRRMEHSIKQMTQQYFSGEDDEAIVQMRDLTLGNTVDRSICVGRTHARDPKATAISC